VSVNELTPPSHSCLLAYTAGDSSGGGIQTDLSFQVTVCQISLLSKTVVLACRHNTSDEAHE